VDERDGPFHKRGSVLDPQGFDAGKRSRAASGTSWLISLASF
jgi:hypothetical protein